MSTVDSREGGREGGSSDSVMFPITVVYCRVHF